MHRLLLTGVGLVLVLYLLPVFYPSETDKTEPQAPTESVTAAATDGLTITVLVNGKAQEMPLETYVEGVTAAEIADDFRLKPSAHRRSQRGRTRCISSREDGRQSIRMRMSATITAIVRHISRTRSRRSAPAIRGYARPSRTRQGRS